MRLPVTRLFGIVLATDCCRNLQESTLCPNGVLQFTDIEGEYVGVAVVNDSEKPFATTAIRSAGQITVTINSNPTSFWSSFTGQISFKDTKEDIPFKIVRANDSSTGYVYGSSVCDIHGFISRNKQINESDISMTGDGKFIRLPDLLMELELENCPNRPNETISVSLRRLQPDFFSREIKITGSLLLVASLVYAISTMVWTNISLTSMALRKMSIVTNSFITTQLLVLIFNLINVPHKDSFNFIDATIVVLMVIFFMASVRVFVLQLREHAIESVGTTDNDRYLIPLYKYIRYGALGIGLGTFLIYRLMKVNALAYVAFAFVFIPAILNSIYTGVRPQYNLWYTTVTSLFIVAYPLVTWTSVTRALGNRTQLSDVASGLSPDLGNTGIVPWFNGEDAPGIGIESLLVFNVNQTHHIWLVFIGTLLAAQCFMIFMQRWWSPRVFIHDHIRSKYLPHIFDYDVHTHTILSLRRDELETGEPIDCVVCVFPIDTSAHDCVVTPCEHFFHRTCLFQWLEVKLQCPTCRNTVPPN